MRAPSSGSATSTSSVSGMASGTLTGGKESGSGDGSIGVSSARSRLPGEGKFEKSSLPGDPGGLRESLRGGELGGVD